MGPRLFGERSRIHKQDMLDSPGPQWPDQVSSGSSARGAIPGPLPVLSATNHTLLRKLETISLASECYLTRQQDSRFNPESLESKRKAYTHTS